MNNDCFRNLHLTTAYGGASPQGEAFGKASKLYSLYIMSLQSKLNEMPYGVN